MANWEMVFSDYKKVEFPQISEYVDTEKPEYGDTLQKQIEEGKSFLYIKKEFYKKYFKKYIPVAKPKKPTMKDWVKARNAGEKK